MVALSIAVLLALIAASAVLPVNLGLLGIAGAFIVGMLGAGFDASQVMAGFPGELFVTLVGVTYLFALARGNGTIDRLVALAAHAVGGRAWALPPLVFVLAALMSALGAPGPAAVAIIAPVALNFARQYGLSPLLMGLMAIHGTQAGAFSPVSIYGGITNQLLARSGIAPDPGLLFATSLAVNVLVAVAVYAVLRPKRATAATAAASPAGRDDGPADPRISREQAFTMAGLAGLAIGTLLFRVDIGFAALCVIIGLAIVSPRAQNKGFEGIDWSTVLLITGIVTYVDAMERIGTIDAMGSAIPMIGLPLLAALLLCMMAGLVSAFASSTALLGVMIPLARPLLEGQGDTPMLLVCAIAISLTIVDTSPFSTNGALVVANAGQGERDALLHKLLLYTVGMVIAGPLAVWAAFIGLPTLLGG